MKRIHLLAAACVAVPFLCALALPFAQIAWALLDTNDTVFGILAALVLVGFVLLVGSALNAEWEERRH